MTFISFSFLLFIAAVTAVYFIAPLKARWLVLLIASLLFYYLNSGYLLLVLMASAAVTYGIGLLIKRTLDRGSAALKDGGASLSKDARKALKERTKKRARRILNLGIALDLGTLLFLKYWNFFADSVNPLLGRFGAGLPAIGLLLPLGISFYTLQAIAYMTDIYRGKLEPDRNPLKFLLFMSFFPQIVQGPIPRHHQLARQLYEGHRFDFRRLCFGIQLMLWGWFKKLVIADRLNIVTSEIFDTPGGYRGLIILFAAALYGLQVYTDFSGGMDIARGFSQMLGIDLEINFNQPYFSRSIEEFWRRWHITLGGWMRDYVFYPLSLSKSFTAMGRRARKLLGNRTGKKIPAITSMFIVYLLVGIWHGSDWKYVVYGLWNGIFIMAGIFFAEGYTSLKKVCGIRQETATWRLFQMARTFLICTIGRYFSRAASFADAMVLFKMTAKSWRDLSFFTNGSLTALGLNSANWFLLIAALLVLTLVDLLHEKGYALRETIARQSLIFRWAIYIAAIIAILVFGIYGPGYDAASFIYEKF